MRRLSSNFRLSHSNKSKLCVRATLSVRTTGTVCMYSVEVGKDDVVLSLVSKVCSPQTASATIATVDKSMSSLRIGDESEVQGTNKISTLLAQSAERSGATDEEKAEVQRWLKASETTIDEELLLDLNTYLAQQTFLVGHDWTVADLVLFARLHPAVSRWDAGKQSEYCHITRWFDHIQHFDSISSHDVLPTLELINKFDKTVTVAIKKAAPKESIKKDPTKATPSSSATAPQQAKKEKKAKESKPAATPVELSPSLISFKVGHIQKAILHPDADSLYVSTVDLGEAEPRTVVSGLVKYIPLEAMQGRRVVCVCNLKPAAMRGIKSSAMVLAASPKMTEGQAKDIVELVTPPGSSQPGDILSFAGFEGEPEAQLNPKKKIFETLQVGFTSTEQLEVAYNDILQGSQKSGKLVNSKGETCTVQTLIDASIR